jgi:hypothetical protein
VQQTLVRHSLVKAIVGKQDKLKFVLIGSPFPDSVRPAQAGFQEVIGGKAKT